MKWRQDMNVIATKVKKICTRLRSELDHYYTKLYLVLAPIKSNKVVFNSFKGQQYNDNPKYIADEIIQRKLKWDLVWIVNDLDVEVPKEVRKVLINSNKMLREIASSRFFIDNTRASIRPPKRKKQIYIQTWHSNLAFKNVEKSVESKLPHSYVQAAKEDGKNCDAIISGCKLRSKDYIENFWLNESTEILEFGIPRNDPLFDDTSRKLYSSKVRSFFGIQNKKIVLYMPTFRDNSLEESYDIDYNRVLKAFKDKFHEDFVIIVKLHPIRYSSSKNIIYSEHCINGNVYPDTQELLVAADFLISDYSSVCFDFALLDRPVFLFVPDINEYRNIRGLNNIFEISPFIRSHSNDELESEILKFDLQKYLSLTSSFREIWDPFDDGNASKRTVDWMISKNN